MNIISQGYYKEMPHGEPTNPSIMDFIGKEDKSLIDNICSYLESGVPLATTPGVVDDIINPDRGVIGTPTALTDGTWVWPGDLSYYVKTYKLKLSDEFIQTMKDNNWKIPITLEDIDLDSLTIDGISPFN
ncbi:MAG: hypothetical protein E7383_01780 [Ruminococcaceae bacterium]|nr:hypothetical protein [Oscillospiraceae bacterium]